jgi:hypothetical protein
MANLHRAFAAHTPGKVAFAPFPKTATLDAPVTVTLAGAAKNLDHCTLDAPILLTLTSVGTVLPIKATLDAAVPITVAAAADVERIGTLDAPIPITLTGVGQYGQNALLDKPITLTLTGTASGEVKGQLNRYLSQTGSVLTLAGAGNVQPLKAALATSITLTLAAVEERTASSPAGVATIPSFTGDAVASTAPNNSSVLPRFVGTAVLSSNGLATASGLLPAFSGSASTGHSSNSTLPALTGSATSQAGELLASVTTLPVLTTNAVLVPDTNSYSTTSIPALIGSSTVVSVSTGVSTTTLPTILTDAVLLAGIDSSSSTELLAFTGSAVLQSDQVLVSITALPALATAAVMDNGVTLATSTFVFNTENLAATEYSNYDFIAMAMFNGVPVGIGSGGVYELTGTDDAGTNIDVDVLSGFDDLGTEDLKRMPNVYIGYKSDGDVQVQVSIDGEPAVRTYTVTNVSNTSGIKRGRAKPARGLKSRYWQVGVKNVIGSDIELEDFGLYVQQFNRKAQ